jgi:DedD protein
MGLFSFLRKDKEEASKGDSEFYSRAEEDGSKARGRRRKQGKAEADDPVLPEKKRARRRLVGAVALVLAAVIGLPMILDSEPKPVGDDIAVQIPSRDKATLPAPSVPTSAASTASRVAASSTLDRKEEMVEIPPPVAIAPAPAAAEAPASKDDKAAPAKLAEQARPAAQDKLAVQEKPAAKAEVKAEAKPEPKPEARPETKSPSKSESAHKPETKAADKANDARAVAILEGKSDKAADKGSEKIMLQVGAFSTDAKINEVRGKLKKAGIQSHTEKVPAKGGDVTRIRVGPLASKEEAAKMRAKLAKLGFDAKTVAGDH